MFILREDDDPQQRIIPLEGRHVFHQHFYLRRFRPGIVQPGSCGVHEDLFQLEGRRLLLCLEFHHLLARLGVRKIIISSFLLGHAHGDNLGRGGRQTQGVRSADGLRFHVPGGMRRQCVNNGPEGSLLVLHHRPVKIRCGRPAGRPVPHSVQAEKLHLLRQFAHRSFARGRRDAPPPLPANTGGVGQIGSDRVRKQVRLVHDHAVKFKVSGDVVRPGKGCGRDDNVGVQELYRR
mmetsp:Transcript_9119/g.18667  ORF Transcript_9119/g.18667 Transcript_9119/m.18667 type:complete len:234 (-) Transcript_9119:1557-2258(-)